MNDKSGRNSKPSNSGRPCIPVLLLQPVVVACGSVDEAIVVVTLYIALVVSCSSPPSVSHPVKEQW